MKWVLFFPPYQGGQVEHANAKDRLFYLYKEIALKAYCVYVLKSTDCLNKRYRNHGKQQRVRTKQR